MVTRTVATYKVDSYEDIDEMINRLREDERAGALKTRRENLSVQAKIAVGMDVELDHGFDIFEDILRDNTDIVVDAAAVGSNDTRNRGLATYYTVTADAIQKVDEYKESEEERYWGEKAAAVMFSRHDINPNSSLFAPRDADVQDE